MEILNSMTYLSDLKTALSQLDIEVLRNKKILITGASGLICSAIVDFLLYCNQQAGTNITIYAAGRSIRRLTQRFPDKEKYGLSYVEYDATREVDFSFPVDYIIHGASNAGPDKYMDEPVDTILANTLGVHNLLNHSRKSQVEKFVYISSSEVYGKLSHGDPVKEDECGSIDILSPRSAYPLGKQAAEALCIGYANQYGINVSIVRPGHIYGPTAQDSDKRIASAFLRQAACGENITMKSLGTQIRSYCYCIDCASAILTVLTKGKNKEAYNISNKNSVITIRQMSTIIAECAGVQLVMDNPSEGEKAAFNPMDNSSLSSAKLEALGWRGQFDAYKGFSHAIAVLREIN